MGGSPAGHIIPGTGLLVVALWVLFHQAGLVRKSWSAVSALRLGALLHLAGASVGCVVEIGDGIRLSRPFKASEHLTMYALFGIVGCFLLLEARGTLPPDTWRPLLALANGGVALLFYVHSMMQKMEEHNDVESFVHWLLYIGCLGTSIAYALSWALPAARIGYTYAAATGQILQTFWFYFLAYALYSGVYGHMGEQLDMGDATSIFVWCLLAATMCVLFFESRFALTKQAAANEANGIENNPAYSKIDKILDEDVTDTA